MRSARGDDDTGQTEPDQAAIDRAIAHMEMLMTSEDPWEGSRVTSSCDFHTAATWNQPSMPQISVW